MHKPASHASLLLPAETLCVRVWLSSLLGIDAGAAGPVGAFAFALTFFAAFHELPLKAKSCSIQSHAASLIGLGEKKTNI